MDHPQPHQTKHSNESQPISEGNLQGIFESLVSLLQQPSFIGSEFTNDPVILKRQNNELKKLVTKQQEKIETYKFRIALLEAKDNKAALEKLEKKNSELLKQLNSFRLDLQNVENEIDLQIEQLKQDNVKLSKSVEQMQIELVKLQQANDSFVSNVKVLGQLAFTFEYYVNLHKGVPGKPTPFRTLVDYSTRLKNPIPLPQQLTTMFTDNVDEYVVSYEVEQLKRTGRIVVGLDFSGKSVTEVEFRDILKSYNAANDDAVEFMINYIKSSNNGIFELRC